MESPRSPEDPPDQGLRVAFMLDRELVFGPELFYRHELEEGPRLLRVPPGPVARLVEAAQRKGHMDLQLVIHGSISHAPYLAVHVVRDLKAEEPALAPGGEGLRATPLLQLQPSTPPDRWHVAGQANLRVRVEGPVKRLTVLH